MEPLGFVAAVTVGVTFVLSGASKLRDPHGFVLAVLEYEVLPPRLARLYARPLPFAEIVCGTALVAGILPVVAAALALAMLGSFLVGVGVNMARGRSLDCHCFGSSGMEKLGWVTLLRLACLVAGGSAVLVSRADSWLNTPPAGALPLVILAMAGVIGLQLLRVAPDTWSALLATGDPAPTLNGGRVSLRHARLPEPNDWALELPVQTVHEEHGVQL